MTDSERAQLQALIDAVRDLAAQVEATQDRRRGGVGAWFRFAAARVLILSAVATMPRRLLLPLMDEISRMVKVEKGEDA